MEDAAVTEGGDGCQLEGLPGTGDSQGGADGNGLEYETVPQASQGGGDV